MQRFRCVHQKEGEQVVDALSYIFATPPPLPKRLITSNVEGKFAPGIRSTQGVTFVKRQQPKYESLAGKADEPSEQAYPVMRLKIRED